MYVLDHAALTHPGTVRDLNEDSVLAAPPVFLVADGIGGHAAGEVASALVVEAFSALARATEVDADAVAATLRQAQQQVRALRTSADPDDPAHAGSTACGAVLVQGDGDPYWVCFNVGDSRLYRRAPDGGTLAQISVDHSHVQELVDAGVITVDEAVRHPERNLVTRAVGTQDEVNPDFWLRPLVPGERLLLCTDGLLEQGLTDEIVAMACAPDPAYEVAQDLLDLSLRDGAKDNVSVIVIDVNEIGPEQHTEGAL